MHETRAYSVFIALFYNDNASRRPVLGCFPLPPGGRSARIIYEKIDFFFLSTRKTDFPSRQILISAWRSVGRVKMEREYKNRRQRRLRNRPLLCIKKSSAAVCTHRRASPRRVRGTQIVPCVS